ncbi:MAG: nitroreductase family protein [Rikenellaceae bacterium]
MNAIEMIKGRRSVRKYKNEKVSRELMGEIVELSRWAPSWANFQVARYTVVDNDAMIREIYERGVNGFAYNMNTLKNAQGVMVLSYVKGKSGTLGDDKPASSKMSTQWEMFDAGIACQTFCLAAHAKGVGTCIFGIIDDAAISEIVGLPEGETVASIITYGFEEGDHAKPTQRHEVKDIMRVAGE